MNSLEQSQQKQESCSQISKETIQLSIATAFERTGTEPYNIDTMISDIISEFPRENTETIVKAIRNGALGMYGKTYKLTTQEVCIWIREFISNRNEMKFKFGRMHD